MTMMLNSSIFRQNQGYRANRGWLKFQKRGKCELECICHEDLHRETQDRNYCTDKLSLNSLVQRFVLSARNTPGRLCREQLHNFMQFIRAVTEGARKSLMVSKLPRPFGHGSNERYKQCDTV